MIISPYFDRFQNDSIEKQIRIEFDSGVITNEDFDGESFELNESLCSDSELRFGSCEASSIKIKIHNIFTPLKDKWLTVSTKLKGMEEPFSIGRYKVFSDVPTADRKYREVVAYDAMYDIIGADVADWYNGIFPDKDSAVTMKQFRESFIRHFELTEVVPKDGLANDKMTVEKTIEPSEISGKEVITAICEINGCFGHIGRDGKIHYIYLPQHIQGLYPANNLYPDHAPDYLPYQQKTGHLYPQDPKGTKIGKGFYISCDYEDFVTHEIDKIQIRQQENDIGCIYGRGNNTYIIQDNFLVYGKSAEKLNQIAKNIYSKISGVIYSPIKRLDAKGNLCFEVGDPIRLTTKYAMIESYILKRTFKGIQALRDNYSSNGALEYSEKVNSVAKSIMQLKGKANILTRTIEETKLEMYDIESELNNKITVTAREIRTELTDAKNNLQSQIIQNAGEIALRVRKDNVIASINLSPETITLEARRIDLKGLVNAQELVSKFATINTLNATKANLENLIATKATISDLNATNATVNNLNVSKLSVSEFNIEKANLQNLIAQKIDASTVKADYMEVKNWTSAGKIKADRIDANTIAAKLGEFSGTVSVPRLFVMEAQDANLIRTSTLQLGIGSGTQLTTSCHWTTITVDKNSYTVLCQ